MNNVSTKNIAILGAGLLGRLLAWQLVKSNHQVTLLEATSFNQPRSAAQTAAAMIAPFSEAVVSNKTIFSIGLKSLTLWPKWIKELNQQTDTGNILFANPGTLAIAHHQDQSELQQLKQDLSAILNSEDRSEWLNQLTIREKEPALENFEQALYLPQEAYLDNRKLLTTLLNTAQKLGANCIDNTPIELNGNEISYPSASDFDHIIDCRGLGAKPNLNNLRGVRGEVIWVHCPELHFQHAIRLMHPRYKLYMVPKPNQQYIIGATEIESEDLSPISVHSTLELASALYTIHPALAEARIIETDSNLRPAFTDNEPRISISENVISINGLHRHGYLLAPSMVENVVKWINSQTTDEHWSYYTRT